MASATALLANQDFSDVQGWMNGNVPKVIDAWAHHYIVELKREFSSTLEIGVHHGRFFLALEAVTPVKSKCFAYDLFEDGQSLNIDNSGKGNRKVFEENVARLAQNKRRVLAVQGDSFSIRENTQLPHKYSLISIDGGHTKEHTVFDLQYANDTLVPGGLVVLDDITNVNWLGVMEGALQFLQTPGRRICPFMAGFNKLFLTTISEANSMRCALEGKLKQHVKRTSLLSGHVVSGLGIS